MPDILAAHRANHERACTISVVIPLLNEEESLQELSSRLEAVLSSIAPNAYEVLFIDDGSTDNSFRILTDIHERNPHFKALRFRRNYGKSAALAVGFARAKGEVVITMDADLQDDPSELPALVEKLHEGYDLVSGWKKKRYDPWHKTMPSKLFNAVVSRTSGITLHDFNCGLKAYRSEVVKALTIYGDMHRYIPALAHWEGFRVTELAVQHHPRKFGVSKFGAKRFVTGFLDLLTVLFTTKYVKRPLHLFGTIGTILVLTGFAIELTLTIEWFLGLTYLSNRPLVLVGVLLIIVGVQLISMGLLGELIVKNSLRGTEQYLLREEL
jgi:glycosyltransferase involved in cell wall biosynthesis